jgi:hypothetical protein
MQITMTQHDRQNIPKALGLLVICVEQAVHRPVELFLGQVRVPAQTKEVLGLIDKRL